MAGRGNLTDWIRDLEARGTIVRFYQSAEWRGLRARVLEESHFECADCKDRGIYTRAEHVHHLAYVHDAPWLALTRGNLVALCHDCHNARHGRGTAARVRPLTQERW